ncbi:MAG: hypothetical protein A2Z11_02870 [Candidatus Woykebacteria bacterium RBG_16_43_9]|uniref:Uncharacterized protein n=1 Tax=Candidatus Woykebacteria bacterium RBG_16_43_9 TaxID=1802596 RepID=A0A1G1WC53_9BACT|nr:MAG: hypothetical protein A2Z11_02870 [Candidatus Woykebacteria bacterium RBG_16_43_9]
MLSKDDLKEIGNLLKPIKKTLDSHTKVLDSHTKTLGSHSKTLESQMKKLEEIEHKLATNTASTMGIEKKIGSALELRKDVYDLRQQVKDHEERINNLGRI